MDFIFVLPTILPADVRKRLVNEIRPALGKLRSDLQGGLREWQETPAHEQIAPVLSLHCSGWGVRLIGLAAQQFWRGVKECGPRLHITPESVQATMAEIGQIGEDSAQWALGYFEGARFSLGQEGVVLPTETDRQVIRAGCEAVAKEWARGFRVYAAGRADEGTRSPEMDPIDAAIIRAYQYWRYQNEARKACGQKPLRELGSRGLADYLNTKRKVDKDLAVALRRANVSEEVSHVWVNDRRKQLGSQGLLEGHWDVTDCGGAPDFDILTAALSADRTLVADGRAKRQRRPRDPDEDGG